MDSPVTAVTVPRASPEASNGGRLRRPHDGSGHGSLFAPRTVRVPLERVPEATWVQLRRLAYQCAAFGNQLLSAQYVKAKGYGPGLDRVAYKDAGDVLSAAVRDAVGRECVGLWRRLGRKILRGEQTLARFSADRALVIRDRGVRLLRRENGDFIVRLRLEPRETDGGEAPTPPLELPVWMPAVKRDRWLRDLLVTLLEPDAITKATVQFERPGRKVFVRLTYERPIVPARSGDGHATVGPIQDGGALWLRGNGHALSLTDTVDRLRHMKMHFAGVHRRLRAALGKRGRRHAHRQALLRAGSFEQWANGPLHQLSRTIVTWCQREGVGGLVWAVAEDGTLPWDRLAALVRYKVEEVGLAWSQIVPPEPQNEEGRPDQLAGATDMPATMEKATRQPRKEQRGTE